MATKASNLTLFSGGIDALGAIDLSNYGGGGGGGTYEITEFTNIAGQSTIVSDYDVGLVEVLVNGVQLAVGDFVATNGTTIVLTEAVELAADIVAIIRVGSVGGGGGGSEHYDSESAPTSPSIGATWRIPSTGILYKRVDDVGNVIWVDISTAAGTAAISARIDYIATAGQTVFAAGYSVGDVDVYLNGVRLVATSDYTATDGTSITLAVGAPVGAEVYILGFTAFQLVDAVAQTDFDDQIALKANQSTTYTKTESDAAINGLDAAIATKHPTLGANSIIRTNIDTISENITIPVNTNGMTAGPVTIADGYTVTIEGTWSII